MACGLMQDLSSWEGKENYHEDRDDSLRDPLFRFRIEDHLGYKLRMRCFEVDVPQHESLWCF